MTGLTRVAVGRYLSLHRPSLDLWWHRGSALRLPCLSRGHDLRCGISVGAVQHLAFGRSPIRVGFAVESGKS